MTAQVHPDPTGKERLGDLGLAVEATVDALAGRRAIERLWAGDHTLWQDDPTEVADRLGWLQAPHDSYAAADELAAFAAGCADDGFTHALVMGMGGSSLFPEVLARSFPSPDGALALSVLDTTDPAAVARVGDTLPLDRTLFVASSKSGTTIETWSHLAHFWDRVRRPEQFAVVTDPGSQLGELGRNRSFRRVVENRPDIGGRYSALSAFGMVPAALAGLDVRALLDGALAMADELRSTEDPHDHPGLRLGATLGAAAHAGRDKLTLLVDPEVDTFGLWLEQLVAESTGKQGTGIVPVVGEQVGEAGLYGRDRVFVSIGWHPSLDALAGAGHPVIELAHGGPYGLGAHVLLWELATAVCGAVLGINPFDQPDVAEAKAATARVLGGEPAPADPGPALGELLGTVGPGDYVAVQAFVDPGAPVVADLERARTRIYEQLGVATTFGLGPRFLHSTGQLHKGGPPTGVFLQVVGDDPHDVGIPGRDHGFSRLKWAQADGDLATLRARGLRATRVSIDELVELYR